MSTCVEVGESVTHQAALSARLWADTWVLPSLSSTTVLGARGRLPLESVFCFLRVLTLVAESLTHMVILFLAL